MATEVAKTITMVGSGESILVDKFRDDFIPEGKPLPGSTIAACGGEAASSFFNFGHMTNGT